MTNNKPPLHRTSTPTEQAPRSWWLAAKTREDFMRGANEETTRMKHSKAYARNNTMVVGQIKDRG